MKHLLKLMDWSQKEINEVLNLADQLKFEKKNGFKHISCHGLRHTYCSILLSQNVPIQTVSRYMGHSDSTVTLQVYAHFIPDTQEKVIDALDKLF